MIIAANIDDNHSTALAHAPSLDDIASLRLEMRTSFHEIGAWLKLLEIEQTHLANKFDALLSLIAEIAPCKGD